MCRVFLRHCRSRLVDAIPRAPDLRQRAVISPLLANIYLHYVFDLWAQQWRGRHANADVIDRCAAMAGARVIGVRPRRHEFTPAKTSKTTGGR